MSKIESLLPPKPGEQEGWGRFKRIWTQFSLAPLEIKLGFGAVWRGIWQLLAKFLTNDDPSPHRFEWDGRIPLWIWGLIVLTLGVWQTYACLYPRRKFSPQGRSWTATLMAATLIYIIAKYAIHDPINIALPLYGPLMFGEAWIALRGHRLFGTAALNGDDL